MILTFVNTRVPSAQLQTGEKSGDKKAMGMGYIQSSEGESYSESIVQFGTLTAVYNKNGDLIQITSNHLFRSLYKKSSVTIWENTRNQLPQNIKISSQNQLSGCPSCPHMHQYLMLGSSGNFLHYECDDCLDEMWWNRGLCFHLDLRRQSNGNLACCGCDWVLQWKNVTDADGTTQEPKQGETFGTSSNVLEPKPNDGLDSSQKVDEKASENSAKDCSKTLKPHKTREYHLNYRHCTGCPAKFLRRIDVESHSKLHEDGSAAVICGLCKSFLRANSKRIVDHKYNYHRRSERGLGVGEFNFKCKACQSVCINYEEFNNHYEILQDGDIGPTSTCFRITK